MTVRRSNSAASVLAAAVLLSAATALSGCAGPFEGSQGQSRMGESLSPAMGGLPADVPARPVSPGAYPAVHDMPPPRNDAMLDETQQAKLENDLAALRARQAKEAGVDKPAAPPANKKPAASQSASQPQ